MINFIKKYFSFLEKNKTSLVKRTIKKEINFFTFDEIDAKTIDRLIAFVGGNPKTVPSRYLNGTNIYFHSVIIHFLDSKPYRIELGINDNASVLYTDFYPHLFYYMKGEKILYVKSPEELNFW